MKEEARDMLDKLEKRIHKLENPIGNTASECDHTALLKDRHPISLNKNAAKTEKSRMVLDLNDDDVTEILSHASAVTQLLIDISPGLSAQNGSQALSDNGAFGLYVVLNALKETIDYAITKS